uniref:Uncharacterized protein n=1 Tax=Sinocyclocheilus grahami TaxID=75366 RepID=A0A672TG80_SINGR
MLTTACSSHYGNAIEEFCLAKFKLDMEVLDQRQWCSWEDTVDTPNKNENSCRVFSVREMTGFPILSHTSEGFSGPCGTAPGIHRSWECLNIPSCLCDIMEVIRGAPENT